MIRARVDHSASRPPTGAAQPLQAPLPTASAKYIAMIDGDLQTDYGPRNSQRLEPYHRMDLSVTWTPKGNVQKKFKSHWVFSVYNIYNRKNTFFTYTDFETDLEEGTASAKAYKVSIFPLLPSITWNFNFQ